MFVTFQCLVERKNGVQTNSWLMTHRLTDSNIPAPKRSPIYFKILTTLSVAQPTTSRSVCLSFFFCFFLCISEPRYWCVRRALCVSLLYLACGIDDFFLTSSLNLGNCPEWADLYGTWTNTLHFCFVFSVVFFPSLCCAVITRLNRLCWSIPRVLLPCFKICAHMANISNDCMADRVVVRKIKIFFSMDLWAGSDQCCFINRSVFNFVSNRTDSDEHDW